MLIGVDMKALEWKTLLQYSQDQVGLEELQKGLDLHTENQKFFSLPTRLVSKKYLFRTIYNRGEGYAFTVDPDFMDVSTSVEYWDDIGKKFYSKYAGVNALHLSWKADLENQGYIESPIGRQHHIPLLTPYGKINWNTFTNHPNQGLGADVMCIFRASLGGRLKKLPWGKHVKLMQTVHDSVMSDAPSDLTEKVARLYHEVARDIPANIKKIFNVNWNVPLECETYYGMDQKNTQELKIVLD